jgi:hypothetical protein
MKSKIKISTIFAFALFAFLFIANKGETQTATETAGQKFKNIKVLNDLPADQLGKVMNIFAESLGVKCAYCHVNPFDKDEKPEKATAREMIKMTLALNQMHFKGRPEISCNTCHRGQEHPQSVPSLTAAPPNNFVLYKKEEPRPTIDQLIEKYVKALGGKSKLDKISSREIRATRVEPDGKTEAEEVFQKANKLSVTTHYEKSVVVQGFDGADVWKSVDGVAVHLKSDEVEQFKRDTQFFDAVNLQSVYSQMDVIGKDSINGKDVYVVRALTADKQRERLFFEIQSGLLVRRFTGTQTMLGFFPIQVDYSEYRKVKGVLFPFSTHWAMPGISYTRKVLKLTYNAPIDDAKFKM